LRSIRRFSLFFLVILAVGFSPGVASPESGKRPLWRVQAKDGVLYLLGSIHYLKPQNYPLDPAIESAFRNAKRVVFEIDLDSAKGDQAQHLMVSKAAYSDGTTLQQHVSETTYRLAAEKLKQLGLESNLFNLFKPWFAATMILARSMQSLGFDPAHGVDQYFYRKAKEANKTTTGLETFEYQLDIFNKMPEFVQDLMLLQSVKSSDSMRGAMDTIVKAWSTGDLKTLDSTLLQGIREYPEVYQRVIVERNRAWLPKIEELLRGDRNAIVIVGAGHLVGPGGVIDLLKKNGWKVTQL